MLFSELGLSPEILSAVSDMGFSETTEIQEKAIPIMLEGKDLIGKSNTGTGKTAAFGIPLIQKLPENTKEPYALILCPTRELAMQACDELKKFSKYKKNVFPAAIYGGASMDRQIAELRRGANIIVGTPGRVMDHIKRKTLKLENIKTVVLDEADEMLNMGFREDIEKILEFVPSERQTVLFSATMPPAILAITDKFQKNPVLIKIQNKTRTVESIEQYYFDVPMGRKTDALKLLLFAYEPKLSMVFCNTKKMVDELSEALVSSGFKAASLHGDMKQQSRTQVLNAFKSGRINLLIATDVAARGIDVNNVDMVFNYDIPDDNEYYIHRIGRTGRAGKAGVAYTLISGRRQLYALKDIASFTKAEIERKALPDRNEILKKKAERTSLKIKAAIDENKYPESKASLDLLMSEGYSAQDIAIALLGMRSAKEMKNVPEFSLAVPKEFDGRKIPMQKIEISVGRKQKIAPNFILASLAENTGISGKSFGKIDIYDNFTTVEVPKSETDEIINKMNSSKINGVKVTVKPYKNKSYKSDKNDERSKRFYNDKFKGEKRNSYKGATNKNRRHQ